VHDAALAEAVASSAEARFPAESPEQEPPQVVSGRGNADVKNSDTPHGRISRRVAL
jgi:hypothetical protein